MPKRIKYTQKNESLTDNDMGLAETGNDEFVVALIYINVYFSLEALNHSCIRERR